MKIVYAVDTYHPRINGVITCIDASLKYLCQRGHELHLICPGNYPEEKFIKNDSSQPFTIHRFSSHSLWFSSNKDERLINFWEISRIKKILKSINPDIIHCHTEFLIGRTARSFALKNNIPFIATAHTYYPDYVDSYFPWIPKSFSHWFMPKFFKSFYQTANIILTPTSEMAKVMQEKLNIHKEITVCFIGIDTNDFTGIDRENERKNSFYFGMFPRWKKRKRLLFVGRLGPEKNVQFLLNAFKDILEQYSNLELIIVGSGSYLEEYQEYAAQNKLASNITFTGAIAHENLKEIYALGDIFTFPSVSETQGLVTLEALYSGLPVVAMNALGTKTVMHGGKGGFLVDNKEEFIDKTLRLLTDDRLYLFKHKEAINHAKNLTFEKTGKILEESYQRAIKNSSSLKKS